MANVRRERVKASQQALSNLPPQARERAIEKARATGRVFPTSGQRERAKQNSGNR